MTRSRIAITGIGCRLPGANSVDELWRLIGSGENTFRDVPAAEKADKFVRVTSCLDEPDMFEPEFFGISPHEALVMDPQQRVLLETTWSAIEDGGYAASLETLKVGVFASVSTSTYLSGPLTLSGRWDDSDPSYPIMIGNDKDFAASRVSFVFGFTGPSFSIQSACSSSLAAAHAASRALEDGLCDIAIVAAASISLPFLSGYRAKEGSIFSPSGRCRPFSDLADGTVKGNGAVAVVLRKSDQAASANDRTYAEISGWGINNDGSRKSGIAAPSVMGQREAIHEAIARSGVVPETVGYFETHGTGTRIGDPIELRSLVDGYGLKTQPAAQRPYVGSLKGTMGHLDAAAGLAGLAKTALVLHHQRIPPLAGFTQANPLIELATSKVSMPTSEATPLAPLEAAAVTSLGMGGTNVHAILTRAAVPSAAREKDNSARTIRISARTESSLRRYVRVLKEWIAQHPHTSLAQIADALASRKVFELGVTVLAHSAEDLIIELERVIVPDRRESEAVTSTQARQHAPVSLPPYQWSRRRYFVEPEVEPAVAQTVPVSNSDEVATLADCQRNTLDAMRNIVNSDALLIDDDFFDNGGDSLSAIDLIDGLHAAYPEASLSFNDLERNPSAAGLGALVHQRLSNGPEQPVVEHNAVTFARSPRWNRLFLAHPAGGSVSMYRNLARHLSREWEVTGLSFPRSRLARSCSLSELAADYVSTIRSIQPEGPYYLGGYSLGGNLSIEIAKILESDGQEVPAIVMYDSFATSDYISPSAERDSRSGAVDALLRNLPEKLAVFDVPTSRETADPSREADMFVQIWKHNQQALANWVPDSTRVASQILLLKASAPFPGDIADAVGFRPTGPDSWQSFTTGEVVVEHVDGSHYTLFDDPHIVAAMSASTERFLSDHARATRSVAAQVP
ncbi:beta-ketoacyl synthase N-terminal-like domain-containing protein [Leifsonia sp. NPDC056665]|uniref:beta-ketoacyl synthase N-terminal-like domain-containing protein n=1 Tax=Leifsonia sp. NPDC056665 TaxID=3345901 RepID=UPI0036ABF0AF